MKSVKSTDDLKRMALTKGASASVGSLRFNTTADKGSPKKADLPPEPKAVDPLPAYLDSMGAVVNTVTDHMAAASKDNARVMEEVLKAVERICAAPAESASAAKSASIDEHKAKAKAWRLTVNRDIRGFMETVDIVCIDK